jgi:hypothetical protein
MIFRGQSNQEKRFLRQSRCPVTRQDARHRGVRLWVIVWDRNECLRVKMKMWRGNGSEWGNGTKWDIAGACFFNRN